MARRKQADMQSIAAWLKTGAGLVTTTAVVVGSLAYPFRLAFRVDAIEESDRKQALVIEQLVSGLASIKEAQIKTSNDLAGDRKTLDQVVVLLKDLGESWNSHKTEVAVRENDAKHQSEKVKLLESQLVIQQQELARARANFSEFAASIDVKLSEMENVKKETK